VSNALPLPGAAVKTAQTTMVYMAISLAITASGLLVCYLLWHVTPRGKDAERGARRAFCGIVALWRHVHLSDDRVGGALLVVAAQAGFTGGPRVLANMRWIPGCRTVSAACRAADNQNGIC